MHTEIRNFRMEDIDALSALYNAAESKDPDFRRLTPEEVRRAEVDDESYDPAGHFVAFEGDRMVASGRGIINPEHLKIRGPLAYLDFHVLPEYLGHEVERDIFGRMVEYLRARGIRKIDTRIDTRYEAKVRLLERLGFEKNDYQNHGMEQDARKMDEPLVPEGYRIRTARIPEEMGLMLDVLNEAFATREKFPPRTMRWFSGSAIFRDRENYSGFFLAETVADGKVVGMVMSDLNRRFHERQGVKRGGTHFMAVIPSHRKRGVGTALLLKSLKWLGDQGMDRAYISVNVANPDAVNIYRAAGYRTVQVYQGYSRKIV